MRNTLKVVILAAMVAVSVAFASVALAAEVVELSSTMGMPALKQKIGEPTSMAGYNGLVYANGVDKVVVAGGKWIVHTPSYQVNPGVPAGARIEPKTPFTAFWIGGEIGGNPPAQPQPNPQPAPQPAPQPNPQPAPGQSEKVVNSQWELNDFVREHGGELGKAENLPSFALSYKVGSKAPKFGDKLPAFNCDGELLSSAPASGASLTVVDREAYFSYIPSNVAEVKALGLYPLRKEGAETKDAGHGVLIKGFVGDWKVAKGFRVNTERGALREGDIVRGGEWGTVYGEAVEKPAPKPVPAPGGSADASGGGGGCNGGMGFAALLLLPFFKKGRHSRHN